MRAEKVAGGRLGAGGSDAQEQNKRGQYRSLAVDRLNIYIFGALYGHP